MKCWIRPLTIALALSIVCTLSLSAQRTRPKQRPKTTSVATAPVAAVPVFRPPSTSYTHLGAQRYRHSSVFTHASDEWQTASQGTLPSPEFVDSFMVVSVPSGSLFWQNLSQPIDATKPFTVSASLAVDSGDQRGAVGIGFSTPSHHYLFGVTPSRRHVALLHSRADDFTQPIQRVGTNTFDTRPQPFVAEKGALNTLFVEVSATQVTLTINGTLVERWPRDRLFSPLSGGIQSIILFALNTSTGRYKNVTVEFGRRTIPDVAGAFQGTTRVIVPELNNRPSSRYPVISPNGAELYLVQNPRHPSDDDVAVATAITDSTWAPAELIGTPVNNMGANSVTAVSQDGNELFLWGRYLSDGRPAQAGMSSTRRTSQGWSLPRNVTIDEYNNAARTREETSSPDRSVLILSAERSGETYGGKDLYVSFRKPDGSYSRPENLGPEVNSPADENTPFLAADGRTLYFSSNSSEDGFGDNDVYVTKRQDPTWTNWSARTNLGRHINTPGWDTYFTIHPSGRYAYMNTTVGTSNGIARLSLPQDSVTRTLLPDPVVVFTGRVLDARTKQPISTSIQYADLRTSEALGAAISDPQTGKYSLVLPGGRLYGMHVSHPGYLPMSDHLLIDTLRAYTVINRDLELEPIVAGATIRLNNIFFDSDASELRMESRAELLRLAELLKMQQNIRVEIAGHTDDRGSETHNLQLSTARAQSVLNFLVQSGVLPGRLQAVGHGKSRPRSKGTTDADRQQNRRVEFKVVSI